LRSGQESDPAHDPNLISQPLPDRPDFLELRDASFRRQLKLVFSGPGITKSAWPLQLNSEPFGSTRIGVSTVLLKNEIQPHLRRAVVLSVVAVLIALFLAAALSNFALSPLTRISQRLDNSPLAGQSPSTMMPIFMTI